MVIAFLHLVHSDPLMMGQRRAGLKYWSPADMIKISWEWSALMEWSADLDRLISYLSWTRSDDWFRSGRSSWFGGDNRGFNYVSLFVMHIRQSIGSFDCSSVSFMNDDFVLHWAASVGVVFSCVLEIELQSPRVHMCVIRRSFRRNELPGWC